MTQLTRDVVHQVKTGQQISHQDLREEYIPRPGTSWGKIVPFASTFNAYVQLGSTKAAAEAGNKKATDLSAWSLTELRSALFHEYRRYNHFGYDPTAEELVKLHALVEQIRRMVQAGEHLHA